MYISSFLLTLRKVNTEEGESVNRNKALCQLKNCSKDIANPKAHQ